VRRILPISKNLQVDSQGAEGGDLDGKERIFALKISPDFLPFRKALVPGNREEIIKEKKKNKLFLSLALY